jgi:hypothetical protein
MIAAMLLRDTLDAHASFAPFFRDEAAAAIGGIFFKAGRFRKNKPAQSGEHLRQARLQAAQELCGEVSIRHGAEMLSTRHDQSNQAKVIVGMAGSWGLTAFLRYGQEASAIE